MPKRQCGGCTECCSALPILELAKPRHEPCKHLCANGCGIYRSTEKPDACSGFECEWLIGNVQENYRPDKFGIIVWFGVPLVSSDGSKVRSVLRVTETRPGAIKQHEAQIDGIVTRIRQRVFKKNRCGMEVIFVAYEQAGTGLPDDGYQIHFVLEEGRRWQRAEQHAHQTLAV